MTWRSSTFRAWTSLSRVLRSVAAGGAGGAAAAAAEADSASRSAGKKARRWRSSRVEIRGDRQHTVDVMRSRW